MANSKINDSINMRIFAALKVSELSGVPLFLLSNPGIGKTTTVKLFAKVRGYEVVALHGNRMSSEAILGYDCAPSDLEKFDSARHLKPAWFKRILENARNGKKSLLFLDELTTCHEYVQASLLSLVFDKEIDSERLPEDTLVVAAGNYANNLSNTATILPPMLNRFMLYNLKFNVNDLDIFFNKYEGSTIGDKTDYFDVLYKQMLDIDSQEKKYDPEKLNMIGEQFEKSIKFVTKALMTSGERPVDLSVTELQTIYSDIEGDNDLPNFISPRSACYARDITIATYIAFGSAGISSENYKNMMYGLVGMGLKRNSSNGEVIKTNIVDEYVSAMIEAVRDIEKMNNDKVPEYESFFMDIIKNHSDGKLDIAAMSASSKKIEELINDPEIKGVDRPMDMSIVQGYCNLIKSSGKNLVKGYKIDPTAKNSDSVVLEKFAGDINYWNNLATLMMSLRSLVHNSNFAYDSAAKGEVKQVFSDSKKVSFYLKTTRKTCINKDAALANIIPDIKSCVDKEK